MCSMNKSNEYFMRIAEAVAEGSKDSSTKVGAVIVAPDGHQISTGFNGMPSGISEENLWEPREMKLLCVLHAEANAILYSKEILEGSTMYVTHSPCPRCMTMILQKKIKTVIYKNFYTKFSSNEKLALYHLMYGNVGVFNINGQPYTGELYA